MKWYLFFISILLTNALFAQDLENISKQKPFAISGSLDIRGIGYSVDGIQARRSPFTYIVSGSPTISIYGLSIPLSFTFSEQDRSFRQPFNQFGLSPNYKWITLHGGYRNITFSNYTLAGYTMLGGGFELRPKKINVGFMYGRLNRAITVDTTSGVTQPFNFSRYGFAGKIGYGTDSSYINLSFLKAQDDEKSIVISPLDKSGIRPAENTVVSIETKLTFAKNFFVYADAGASIYTKDFQSKSEIKPNDAFKNVFDFANNIMKINATSSYYLAYSTGIGYSDKKFGLKAEYKHIDPDFTSMGAYFFNNDLENITLSPRINALQGKLRFTGSIGVQRDNLRNQKQATTQRVIGAANLGWDITNNFGIDANYVNFSSNSEPIVSKVQEKYLLTQTTQNFSFNPRLILARPKTTNVILLSYNLNTLVDLNTQTQTLNNINTNVVLLNYNLTLNQSGISINTGLNMTNNKIPNLGEVKNYGMNFGVSKGFLKNKLQISSNNSLIISEILNNSGTILNLGLNSTYQPAPHHRISLRANFLKNSPKAVVVGLQPQFSESTGEMGYTLSF
jgi:hypothetical protein